MIPARKTKIKERNVKPIPTKISFPETIVAKTVVAKGIPNKIPKKNPDAKSFFSKFYPLQLNFILL